MIIQITDDFDLERIAESGQCFRWERLQAGSYRILHKEFCLYAEDYGNQQFSFSCGEPEFDSVWRDYFDHGENYTAIRNRVVPGRDPFLSSAAEQEKGLRILRQDPWEMLITFIISQNKNIPAIRRSVELLSEISGEEKVDCRGRRYYAFPTPRAIVSLDADDLKACRLGYRCRYVHEAAVAVLDGWLDMNSLALADEEETIRVLTELPGVGVKVANCISLFGFHHINAFPQDVWMKRILQNEYPQGYPFDAYAPYNGVYQQYMFAYYRKINGKASSNGLKKHM